MSAQDHLLTLEYVNWREEEKLFRLDPESIYLKGGQTGGKGIAQL